MLDGKGRRHGQHKPGGTIGYPAHPRLIRPSCEFVCESVCESVRKISFNYSAEIFPGPTDLVKTSLKNVN